MKKLFVFMVVAVFSTATLVQAQTEKKAESKPAAPKTEAKAAHSDYAMMDGKMTHCMGEKHEPMTKDVTLKNGTMISMKGEVTTKAGKKTMLQNGQTVDMNGNIVKFDDLHKGMKMDEKKKM
jgi:hypothetical protein